MSIIALLSPRLAQTIPALLGLLASLLAGNGKAAPEIQDLFAQLDRLFAAWKASKTNDPTPAETDQDQDYWICVFVYDQIGEPRLPCARPPSPNPALPVPVRRTNGLFFQSETRVLFVPPT